MANFTLDSDGTVYCIDKSGTPKLLIPAKLETRTIKKYHDSVFSGHAGISQLTALMKKRVYFKNMDKKIRDFVSQCDICAKTKSQNRPIVAPMKLYPPESIPFAVTHFDFAGPIITPNDPTHLKYALLITCRMSHWIEIYPMQEISAETLMKTFVEEFVPLHGLPKKIVTDGGSQFT